MGPFEFSPWGGPTATWILVQAPLGNIIRKDETLRGLSTSCPPVPTSTILFTDKTIVSTRCGRPHLPGQQKIKLNQVFAGQAVGIKDVHDDIWLMSIMDYDLGYFDLETRVLEGWKIPSAQSVTHVAGTFCDPCLRAGPVKVWWRRLDSNQRPRDYEPF
jgi:hypothetical protein